MVSSVPALVSSMTPSPRMRPVPEMVTPRAVTFSMKGGSCRMPPWVPRRSPSMRRVTGRAIVAACDHPPLVSTRQASGAVERRCKVAPAGALASAAFSPARFACGEALGDTPKSARSNTPASSPDGIGPQDAVSVAATIPPASPARSVRRPIAMVVMRAFSSMRPRAARPPAGSAVCSLSTFRAIPPRHRPLAQSETVIAASPRLSHQMVTTLAKVGNSGR